MKKADKICILLIMAACVLFYIPLWFAYDAQENREVVVKVRNKEVLRTDLMKDGSYTVDGKLGEVLVEVQDGRVRVKKKIHRITIVRFRAMSVILLRRSSACPMRSS